MAHFGIVIHGGAGEITRDQIAPAQYEAYMEALRLALDTAYKVLWEGGASAEAVCAAVEWMENCPLFNAGKGSCSIVTGRWKWTRLLWTEPLFQPVP